MVRFSLVLFFFFLLASPYLLFYGAVRKLVGKKSALRETKGIVGEGGVSLANLAIWVERKGMTPSEDVRLGYLFHKLLLLRLCLDGK